MLLILIGENKNVLNMNVRTVEKKSKIRETNIIICIVEMCFLFLNYCKKTIYSWKNQLIGQCMSLLSFY